MKKKLVTYMFFALFALSALSMPLQSMVSAQASAERGTLIGHNIRIQGLIRRKKMQTFQSSTAVFDLVTQRPVGHYGAGKRFDTSKFGYKNGMLYYLDLEAYQQGKYYGYIANKVFEVNPANGRAIVDGRSLPIRNGMPLSDHRTSGGQCTAPRPWSQGLNNEYVKIIQKVEIHTGRQMRAKSVARSYGEQVCLWNALGQNTARVARPGTSRHETGLAIDFESSTYQTFDRELRQYGLCTPVAGEPWHYEPCWAR